MTIGRLGCCYFTLMLYVVVGFVGTLDFALIVCIRLSFGVFLCWVACMVCLYCILDCGLRWVG